MEVFFIWRRAVGTSAGERASRQTTLAATGSFTMLIKLVESRSMVMCAAEVEATFQRALHFEAPPCFVCLFASGVIVRDLNQNLF